MNPNSKNIGSPEELWAKIWPINGLEAVMNCPVCNEKTRKILHTDLVDNVFHVAPGKWSLWKCTNCGCAYLNPRPTRDTIPLAYENYFTHQSAGEQDGYAFLRPSRKLRRRLANGYVNWRYSGHAVPSSKLGLLAAFVMPNLKNVIDCQYRHIPRLPKRGGGLLDVGCGNGSFLTLASASGWDAVGIEPDPRAAENCKKQGLNVYEGGIEYFEGKKELFDVITLNHVIEHVHDPIKVLRACYDLLKPGGQIWLETPNINSFGHARFKSNWRGLETPRHLVLFDHYSLNQSFIKAGFLALQDRARPSVCVGIFKRSFAMENRRSGQQLSDTPKALLWQATLAACAGVLFPSRREVLTVTARKVEK